MFVKKYIYIYIFFIDFACGALLYLSETGSRHKIAISHLAKFMGGLKSRLLEKRKNKMEIFVLSFWGTPLDKPVYVSI